MVQENPVYCKIEYSESISSKKELLSAQVSLLNLVKTTKRYALLRNEEFKIKSQIYKNLKETESLLNKTRSLFPFIKVPKKIKRENLQRIEKSPSFERIDDNLEIQLEEIRKKLKDLEN
jgi:hypothetical protein